MLPWGSSVEFGRCIWPVAPVVGPGGRSVWWPGICTGRPRACSTTFPCCSPVGECALSACGGKWAHRGHRYLSGCFPYCGEQGFCGGTGPGQCDDVAACGVLDTADHYVWGAQSGPGQTWHQGDAQARLDECEHGAEVVDGVYNARLEADLVGGRGHARIPGRPGCGHDPVLVGQVLGQVQAGTGGQWVLVGQDRVEELDHDRF